jgi:hypothetical protein
MDMHNLKMHPVKCDFLRHEASFLGHVLRADGILTQDSKISAIKNWPPLTDSRSVRAFVSLCSYYRKYIWRFAEITAPLTNLLKDGGWRPPSDPDVLTAVDKLKEALISSPVLAYFDVNTVSTDLYSDASDDSKSWLVCVTDVCIFGISSWVFLSRYARTTSVFDGFLVNQILRLSTIDGLLSLVNFR